MDLKNRLCKIMTPAVGASQTARSARRCHVSGVLAGTALATLLMLDPLGGAALAQTSDTIFACVNKNGKVRLVEGPSACSSKETAVSWNVVGPPGPPGPPASDTSAATLCSGGEVLTGNGSCVDLQALIDDLQAQIDDLQPGPTAFLTSGGFDGNFGGLIGADATCQAAADGPTSIVPPGTYLAWLSDDFDSPSTRFTQSTKPYRLPDGTKFADNYADLTDGFLRRPLNMTETGTIRSDAVWTNTAPDGTPIEVTASLTCENWTSTFGSGRIGGTNVSDAGWTDIGDPFGIGCESVAPHLYCFQQ